jgi:hypothetical protein
VRVLDIVGGEVASGARVEVAPLGKARRELDGVAKADRGGAMVAVYLEQVAADGFEATAA